MAVWLSPLNSVVPCGCMAAILAYTGCLVKKIGFLTGPWAGFELSGIHAWQAEDRGTGGFPLWPLIAEATLFTGGFLRTVDHRCSLNPYSSAFITYALIKLKIALAVLNLS